MKLYLIFLLFLSILFPKENKKISIDIYDYDKIEWWSKFNNNGLNFTQSNISLSYKNDFDNYELLINTHISNEKIIVGESYISFPLSDIYKVKFGRYYRDFSSYLNDELSSGSMLIGINALPIPKIGLLGEYQIKKNNKFKLTYGLAHSILDKNDIYNESPFIHEKFLYLIKNEDNYDYGFGFVHEAIWAGSTYINGKFPSSFNDFLKVIISADGEKIEGQSHANALGNHLGIWDFYFTKKNKYNVLKFYYQHLFEDTSGLRFQNRFDGLWGIEYKDLSSKFNYVLEYINTSNQDRDPPYVNENYYNHSEYKLGWSYKSYVIGNPFIDNINNNPSKVIHAGISYNDLNNYKFKILLSKRIDTNDTLKYSVSVGKVFQNFTTSFFINGMKSKNIGLTILYDI
tara:strand:- start:6586 stop:7788 length:1203 start_codon:yes stop_codon:yes gene_type:complete